MDQKETILTIVLVLVFAFIIAVYSYSRLKNGSKSNQKSLMPDDDVWRTST